MENSCKHCENYRERLTPFQLTLQHHNRAGHFLLAPVSRHEQDGEVGDPDPRIQRARRPGQPQGETQGEVQDQEEQRQRPAAPQAEGSQHSVQVSLLSMLSTQKCIVNQSIMFPTFMTLYVEYNIGNGQLSDVTGSAHVMGRYLANAIVSDKSK